MKAFEYTTIPYEKIKEEYNFFNEKFRKGLEEYLSKQDILDSLYLYNQNLKTQNYVGVIKYKDFQLDILPKLLSRSSFDKKNEDEDGYNKYEEPSDKNIDLIIKNLLFMLSKTEKLDINFTEYANIRNCDNPFLEVLIREYAVSLFECLKRLTPRNYVREEDNLNYLKGKLKFTENIRYNCANQAKFYCEFDEFSENNELNRLFLFVAKSLFKISKNSENKKTLSFIMNYFCDVPFVKTDKYKAEKIILTRNQKLFELPFKLAKMFLNHLSVDITNNTIENLTILWDMNILFEEFVYMLLKRGQRNFRVSPQEKKPLLKRKGTEYRDTFVDIYIEKEHEEEKIVLDTKYKINSFKNADIYQVCTYCLLHKSHNAILFYPEKYEPAKVKADNEIIDKGENYNEESIQQNKEDVYFSFDINKSCQLNTDETDVFIHRMYINLCHKELHKIFNEVNILAKFFDDIIKQYNNFEQNNNSKGINNGNRNKN
jgi:5-methylcytosine-specific restriction enzyme subunit McrC